MSIYKNDINVSLNIGANTQQAQQQIQALQASLNKLNTAGTGSGVSAEMQKAAAAAQELQMHLSKAYNTKTGNLDLSLLNRSLATSKEGIQGLSASLINAGKDGQAAFVNLAKSIASANQPMLKTNTLLTNMWTTLKNTARWQISSSILQGFMGSVQKAYQYAQDLNKSLTDIRIVTGYSADKMKDFAVEANNAAKALSTTTNEYAKASLIYFQQGLNDQQVKERADVTAKMANVTRDSAQVVSDQMTAIWNNFDDGSKSLEYYADVITALGAATASSTKEISDGLEKFAAVAETVGLSYEYAASALATITSNTRQSADVVGTALKTLFARIQGLSLGETLEDGTDLNKYSEALAKVGISIKESNGELKAMDDILNEMADVWDRLNNDQQVALAQTVAGVRQYTQLVALMENWDNGDEDSMMANLRTSADAEGTLQEQQDIYAESWEAASKRAKAALEEIYATLLDDTFFIKLTNTFADLTSGIGEFIKGIGGMKGILTSIASILLITLANKVPSALNSLKYNFSVLFGGAQKEAEKLGTAFNQSLNKALINSNFSDLQLVEIKNAQKLLFVRSQYSKVSSQLTEQERLNAEIAINSLEKQQQEVVSLTKKQEELIKTLNQQTNNSFTSDKILNTSSEYIKSLEEQLVGASKSARYQIRNRIDIASTDETNALEAERESVEKLKQAYINMHKEKLNPNVLSNSNIYRSQLNQLNDLNTQLKTDSKHLGMTIEGVKNSFDLYTKSMSPAIRQSESFIKVQQEFNKTSPNWDSVIKKIDNFIVQTKKGSVETGKLGNTLKDNIGSKEFDKLNNGLKETKKLTEELKNRQEQLNNTYKQMPNSFNHTATTLEKITKSAGGFSSLAMGLNSLKAGFEALKNPDISGFEKFTSILSSFSMGLLMTINGVNTLTQSIVGASVAQIAHQAVVALSINQTNLKILQDTKQLILEGKLSKNKATLLIMETLGISKKQAHILVQKILNGEITKQLVLETLLNKTLLKKLLLFGKIALAIAAVVVVVKTLVAAWKAYKESQPEEQLKKAKEELDTFKKSAEDAKTAIDNLKNAFKDYKDAKNAIKELQKGTEEFAEAVENANDKARALINEYGITKGIAVDENGIIQIDQDSYNNIEGEVNTRYRNTLAAQLGAQQNVGTWQEKVTVSEALSPIEEVNINTGKGEWISNASDIKILEDNILKYIAEDVEFKEALLKGDEGKVEATTYLIDKGIIDPIATYLDEAGNATSYALNTADQAIVKGLFEASDGLLALADSSYEAIVGNDANTQAMFASALAQEKAYQNFADKTDAINLATNMYEQSLEEQRAALEGQEPDQLYQKLAEAMGWESVGDGLFTLEDGQTQINLSVENVIDRLASIYATETSIESLSAQTLAAIQGAKEGAGEYGSLVSAILSGYGKDAEMTDAYNFSQLTEDKQLEIAKQLFEGGGADFWQHTYGEGASVEDILGTLQSLFGYIDENGNQVEGSYDPFGSMENLIDQQIFEPYNFGTEEEEAQAREQYLQRIKDWWANLPEEDKKLAMQVDFTEGSEENWNQQIKDLKETAEADAIYEEAAASTGYDVDAIKEYGNYLAEVNGLMGESKVLIAEIAAQHVNFAKGSEELKEVMDDSYEAIKNWANGTEQATIETFGVISKLQTALEKMFGVKVSAKFIKENLKDIKKLADGDTKALQKLRYEAAKDFTYQIRLEGREDVANAIDSLINKFKELEAQGEKEIGFKLNEADLQTSIDQLNALIESGATTAAEINQALATIGWTASVDYKDVPAGSVKGGIKWTNPDGSTSEGEFEGEAMMSVPIIESVTPDENGKIGGGFTKTATAASLGSAQTSANAPSSSGGGGGGEELKDPKNYEDEIERYHENTRALERLERALDKVTTAKDRAFGKERLRLIDEEIAATERLVDQQKQYLAEIEGYAEIDRSRMEAYGFTFDEYGEITNYNDVYRQQVDKFNASRTDAAEEAYNEFKDTVEQYEETITLLDEEQMKYQEYLNSLVDLKLEKITTEVEVKIRVNDIELTRLEYMLKKLQREGAAAADEIKNIADQINETMEKAGPIQEAIDKIYEQARAEGRGLNAEEIAEMQSFYADGIIDAQEQERVDAIYAKANAENRVLTQAEEDQIQEYKEQLLELNEEVWELADAIEGKLGEELDELDAEFDESLNRLTSYTQMYENLQNVLELTGKSKTAEGLNALNQLAASTLKNSTNALKANKASYDTFVELAAEANRHLQEAIEVGDQHMIDYWTEQVEDVTIRMEEAHVAMLESFNDALEAAGDLFDTKVENMITKLKKDLGDLDTMVELYDRAVELENLYLSSNQSIYELSKLTREVGKSIEDTSNLIAKNKLNDLMKELNKLRAEGVQLSKYDLEYLQAKYELELAEIALQEAQEAKSQVKLTRNNEGGWGYVYTADSDKVAEAEQNFEDKTYNMQQLNADYITDYSEQLLKNRQEMTEALANIDKTREDYDAEVLRVKEEYMAKEEFYVSELTKAYERQGIAYEDTILGMISNDESLLESHENFKDRTLELIDEELIPAHEEWLGSVQDVCDEAGYSYDELTDGVLENMSSVNEASVELTEKTLKEQEDMRESMKETMSEIKNWQAQYLETINAMVAANEAYYDKTIADYTNAMDQIVATAQAAFDAIVNAAQAAAAAVAAAGGGDDEGEKKKKEDDPPKEVGKIYVEGNTLADVNYVTGSEHRDYLITTGRITAMATGGYTGTWGPEGKVAMLHEKELVLNKHDTKNMLDMVNTLRDIDWRAKLSELWTNIEDQFINPVFGGTEELLQQVHIEANFPDLKDHFEIEEAFHNLINTASQYANRKHI